MAIELGAAGAKVALVGRDRAKLDETAALVGAGSAVFRADVTDVAQVGALDRGVREKCGHVDILINNAGMNIRKPLVEYTLDEWNTVLDSNLTSVFLVSRSFIPMMRGRGWGRIINLASIMSHVSLPGRTAYSASKAALLGITRALAQELAEDGIYRGRHQSRPVCDGDQHRPDGESRAQPPVPVERPSRPLGKSRRNRETSALPVLRRRRFHHRIGYPYRRRLDIEVA